MQCIPPCCLPGAGLLEDSVKGIQLLLRVCCGGYSRELYIWISEELSLSLIIKNENRENTAIVKCYLHPTLPKEYLPAFFQRTVYSSIYKGNLHLQP